MTRNQLYTLKVETQEQLDQIVPGKVKVSIEKDDEGRGGNNYILIGEYNYHTMLENGKIHTSKSTWTERIDNFFTDNKLFLGFFKQRRDFMNAGIVEQATFNGHPAEYTA